MMMEKVYAYITHEDRLLVFRHTHYPEAGIQVPGGTVEGQESPQEAVLREAGEETGLDNLKIFSYLGMHTFDLARIGDFGIQNRHFFQLRFQGDRKDNWHHFEGSPSDGHPGPIEFEFFWVKYPEDVPELAGNQGVMLHKVKV
jgi:8-oxo-dGTP diphosphatase